MKKLCAAVLLGLTAVTGMAGAEEAVVSPEPARVTLAGEVLAYEGGTMYLVGGGEVVMRTDLGEKGGRLLRHTPFTVTGVMEEDEKGPYLRMEKVDYSDPAPLADYRAAWTASSAAVSDTAETGDAGRDAAYDHGAASSASAAFYVSGRADLDTSLYAESRAADLADMEEGAKVSVVGRAVRTVEEERVMLFWDAENAPVEVVMNGAYIPLGQRCTVYGTVVQRDGGPAVSLERVESVG